MSNGLLKMDDLMTWTGIKQRAALIRWLDKAPAIPYKISPGTGEVCTTEGCVTAALLAGKQFSEDSETWAA